MAESDSYDEFLGHYSGFLDQLVTTGWTPQEVYGRFTTLYPQVNPDFIHKALNSGQWTFVGRKEHLLNNVMMAAALWYAVAVTHDLEPDPEYTAVHLDTAIVQDIPRLFNTVGVPSEDIATIMSRCGAALKYLAKNPYIRLDEASYDDFFENLPTEARHISDDVLSWPPNRSIIEDRLGDGDFSLALLRVGICPAELEEMGLDIAAASLTDRSFRNALGEFLSYCIRYDRKPSLLLYGGWSTARNQLGRVPLVGAIRAKYGSWHRALRLGRRLVNDALRMTSAQAVPARSMDRAESSHPRPYRIEDLNAQGIGVIEQATISSEEKEEQIWESLTSVFLTRLRELPWNQTLRVYYLTPGSFAHGDYTPYVSILRTPVGYLCEITDSAEFTGPIPDYDIDYLHERGWVEPRDGTLAWTQNFFDVSDAAQESIYAMRFGLDCTHPSYFQSDDPSTSAEAPVSTSSADSVSAVLPHPAAPGPAPLSNDSEQRD